MTYHFIVNPISGHANNTRYVGHLIDLIEQKRNADIRTEIHVLQARGEAAPYAKELANRLEAEGKTKETVIVSVGGDGTINEIASALVGTNAQVAIVPRGSGNGLARMLQLPNKPQEQVNYLLTGHAEKIDSGQISDHAFFCTAGFGFESDIAFLFDKTGDKRRGWQQYVKYVISEIINYKGVEAELELDGEHVSGRFITLSFANANQYGNNAFIAPNASIQDGLLNVTMLKPFPVAVAGMVGAALLGGYIDRLPFTETRTVKNAKILSMNDDRFHCDGEPVRFNIPTEVNVNHLSLNAYVQEGFKQVSPRLLDTAQERVMQLEQLPTEVKENLHQLKERFFRK